mmetsp:Transcript_22488/g.31283  ORF Transcript_22488/g.31283 Transcript_22488/m.31283 type:complete len:236 (-) Transcript_22488:388-1095(-)|eukprot:CAMPEP_0196588568 /NCGR_PEP_ID=MMETSP1081-20130531/60936_1 /TAXON_ID=36882 /ORGANISM="Pyramimonas amylifera, Strain CCMP720" /LENGTH=235 /DNA_ID=CAMNT_0041911097 /DNA_START=85 /DNA_END=792 /DNA_ORIENTATION=+
MQCSAIGSRSTKMLLPFVQKLNSKKLILASASPRRSELLEGLGLQFQIVTSTFEETLDKAHFVCPADYALETATQKALEVAMRQNESGLGQNSLADLVIGADTVVDLDGEVMEKPDGEEGARRMLSKLSGSRHKVHTGVALVLPQARDSNSGQPPMVLGFAETTEVQFDVLKAETIDAYIASGEPFGKAGSYGIQGFGGSFVSGINGCYFNVVGFPIRRFSKEVEKMIDDHLLTC